MVDNAMQLQFLVDCDQLQSAMVHQRVWSYRGLGGSRGEAAVVVGGVVEFRVRIWGCSAGFPLGWSVHLSVFGTFPH